METRWKNSYRTEDAIMSTDRLGLYQEKRMTSHHGLHQCHQHQAKLTRTKGVRAIERKCFLNELFLGRPRGLHVVFVWPKQLQIGWLHGKKYSQSTSGDPNQLGCYFNMFTLPMSSSPQKCYYLSHSNSLTDVCYFRQETSSVVRLTN